MSQLTLTYLMYLFFLSKIVITVIRFFVRFENAILINDGFIVFSVFMTIILIYSSPKVQYRV